MSCSCNCNPCSCTTSCDPNDEALSSVLTNLTTSLIGTPIKTCVNSVVAWTLPCDLDNGTPSFPKNAGESIACYFLRFMSDSSMVMSTGLKGYETTALTNSNDSLTSNIDVQDQDYTGTLSGPVSISLVSAGATTGDHFYLSLTGLIITNVNTLTIKTDSTTLQVFNTSGTATGYMKAVFTGTAWKLTSTDVNIV